MSDIPKPGDSKRSKEWPKVRKEHLKKFPTCAACGGKKKLEAHHKLPFHIHPEFELDPTNLITLCEGNKNINCHITLGHSFNFKGFNPDVELDSAALLTKKVHTHLALAKKKTP